VLIPPETERPLVPTPPSGPPSADTVPYETFYRSSKARRRALRLASQPARHARDDPAVIRQPSPLPVPSPPPAPATAPAPRRRRPAPVVLAPGRNGTRSRQKVAAADRLIANCLRQDDPSRTSLPILAAFSTTDSVTGKPLRYQECLRGVDGALWAAAHDAELRRLHEETGTVDFCAPHTALPPGYKPTYYNPVPSLKVKDGVEVRRIRGTAGGDRIAYPGDTVAEVAAMSTVKLHLNAVLSTPGATYVNADIKDFYLGTPMDTPEYMYIQSTHFPPAARHRYNIAALEHNGRVLCRINKGIYGLPQAGRLAQDRLIAHLATHGYHQTSTPLLFRHVTRPISFTLIVDDFGILTVGDEHVEHLLAALRELYAITVDYAGSKYIGFHLAWDYTAGQRSVRLSIPDYVKKALARFDVILAARPTHAPNLYTAPVYGSKHPQLTSAPDCSPPLSPPEIKRLQQIVGVFLYYASAIDCTMKVAVSQLGSSQAHATQAVAADADRLMQYAGTWPNATLVYQASDMCLHIHSDASYLSEPHARSRAGGYFYLGSRVRDPHSPPPAPAAGTGPIHIVSTIIDVVCASAAEAEYGAMFINAKEGEVLRTTLANLGFPQLAPTPLQGDNSCAVDFANSRTTQRRSKAIDMRFHWLRDRVRQRHFHVYWQRGATNLADFFTKRHPVKHHRAMRRYFVFDP
jgi:hypothetical protein